MSNISNYIETNKETLKPWLEDNQPGRIEIKILPYLKDIDNGFFVEAGALNGLFMSNTKLLEDLGWEGLLVEPSKKAVKECEKNRKAIVERYALVSNEYKEPYITGDFLFDGEDGVGAWSSINRQAYLIRTGNAVHGMITQVPAITLDKLLLTHNRRKVDFLSLDVEGYEFEVLKGIDFDTTDITYILIEINTRDYTKESMDAFLKSKGYSEVCCLSSFSKEADKNWDGTHNDYLYKKDNG